jgi:transposase
VYCRRLSTPIADAVSYCGLTAAFRSSAGKQQRGPLSKQRNAWLQSTLIEAAKLAPRWNPQMAQLYAQQMERGHANRATLKFSDHRIRIVKPNEPYPP